MPAQLPQIRHLAGEKVYFTAEFHPHLILRYLSEGVLISDRRVVVRKPSTIFGLIPFGHVEESLPIDHISDAALGRRTSGWKVVRGVVALLAALYVLLMATQLGGESAAVAVLLMLVLLGYATYQFLTAKQNGFTVRSTGAGTVSAAAGWGEDQAADSSKALLNVLVYGAPRIPESVSDQILPLNPPPSA